MRSLVLTLVIGLILSVSLMPMHLGAQTTVQPPVTFGIKGGVLVVLPGSYSAASPSTRFTLTDQSKRYTIGPMIELKLPASFWLEVDALYKRSGSRLDGVTSLGGSVSSVTWQERVNSWEFPVLLKRYFTVGEPVVKPYALGGYSLNRGKRRSYSKLTHGVACGGGIQFSKWRLKFSPEFRYTRWTDEILARAGFGGGRNQPELLLGVTF